MRRRSGFRDAAEYVAALVAVKSLEYSPRPLADRLGLAYARLLDLAIPRLRRVAVRNLEIAGYPEADRPAIADEVFRSIGRLLTGVAKLPRIRRDNAGRWIRYEGFEHFERAQRAGKGVLFATGHLGNWELSAHAHALLTAPMHVVVRPLDNPWLDGMAARRRALAGNRVIEKKDFARGILTALKRNEAVGILVDQNAALDGGVFVDFFGTPACAAGVFARLAARSGAAVIPGFAIWSKAESRYILRFDAPVPMTGDVQADTQAVQSAVELAIRRDPGQWLWIHRRWKTRPPGSAPLY